MLDWKVIGKYILFSGFLAELRILTKGAFFGARVIFRAVFSGIGRYLESKLGLWLLLIFLE